MTSRIATVSSAGSGTTVGGAGGARCQTQELLSDGAFDEPTLLAWQAQSAQQLGV